MKYLNIFIKGNQTCFYECSEGIVKDGRVRVDDVECKSECGKDWKEDEDEVKDRLDNPGTNTIFLLLMAANLYQEPISITAL